MRKRTAETGLFLPLPFFNFSVYYHAKLQTITETPIQTRKLHAVSVFVSYPPFFNSIFRQANTPFSQNRQYPTPFSLPFYTITETPDFCVKVYFCLIVRFFPLSPHLGEGSKVNTPSADCHRFSNHSKIKQEIPATSNVPESLVFSGFPNILFMPFVSIKRFTFPHRKHKQLFPFPLHIFQG